MQDNFSISFHPEIYKFSLDVGNFLSHKANILSNDLYLLFYEAL